MACSAGPPGGKLKTMFKILETAVNHVAKIEKGDVPLQSLCEAWTTAGDPRRSAKAIKRLIDISVTLFLLPALLPMMGLIALAIRLDSPGPIFFVQVRVGENRRRRDDATVFTGKDRRKSRSFGPSFRIFKFRTMCHGTPTSAKSPWLPTDPRLTRVGKWLRRRGLDELPQFINVLIGNMSLVGPRPETPRLVAEYDPQVRLRLDFKPGITGLWQVFAPRNIEIYECVYWDLYYLANWSLKLDLAILAYTPFFSLDGHNV